MQIMKIYQLPDLIHDHAGLYVHLDPQDGLKAPKTNKFGFPLKNRNINTCIVSCIISFIK